MDSPRLLPAMIAITVLVVLTLATGHVLFRQKVATERLNRVINRQHESIELAYQLRQSSDELTRMARSYAATGDQSFKEHFYTVLDIREGRAPRPPPHSIIFWDSMVTGDELPGAATGENSSLRSLIEQAGFSDEELQLLVEAHRRSDRLVELEETAMNALEGRFPDEDGRFSVVGEPDRELALEILFGEEYLQAKSIITRPIGNALLSVHNRALTTLAAAQQKEARLRSVLGFLLGALFVILPLFLFVAYRYHRVSSAKLIRSEEQFRSTFEQAAVGIAHVSPLGRFLRINDRFCDIVGYTREEMLARTFQDITHPDDLDADLEHMRQLLGGESLTYSMEKRYLRKDGETVWVNLTVSLLRNRAGDPRWFVSVVEDITKRKTAEVRVRVYQERLRALAAELTVTEERERLRVAGELHDGAVQPLTWARMSLDSAKRSAVTHEQATALGEVSNFLRKTTLEINQIAADLSSPLLNELGLAPAISEWMTEQVSQRVEIETELVDQRDEDDREDLDDTMRAILFRNVRELLANVVQHAQATKVVVVLKRSGDRLELAICDNGIGCDAAKALKGGTGGFGLFAIWERMADLGGSLEVDSAPGKGFIATLVMPEPPRASAAPSARRGTA